MRITRTTNAVAHRPEMFLVGVMVALVTSSALGQGTSELPVSSRLNASNQHNKEARRKESTLIQDVVDPELIFRVAPKQSRLLRTKSSIARLAITDPSLVEVNEFGPNEVEIIGLKSGETTMTLWFDDNGRNFTGVGEQSSVLRYLVKVDAGLVVQQQADAEYAELQARMNELFPQSQVQLFPIGNKLILRGQARDAKEAAEILSLVGQRSSSQGNGIANGVGNASIGTVARLNQGQNNQTNIINLMHVPGEHQVMLKVRIAELSRSATRELGIHLNKLTGALADVGDGLSITGFLGDGGQLSAILDGKDLTLFLRAFNSHGHGKILAEPTLVTLSGKPATFLAGGQFPVPTTVGVDGVSAASTTFQSFGTTLNFTPTVIDKDKIRLEVAPTFSTVNQANSVQGIPGLDTRSVTTTVDLREGQWLAIAGLIQDRQSGSKGGVPILSKVPALGRIFGNQQTSRQETELIVLVSPELVHPAEPEQVPLFLPGMEVTEPTDHEFYHHRQIEGNPHEHHRSTIWAAQRHQATHHGVDTNYGNVKERADFHTNQKFYLRGDHGFSK